MGNINERITKAQRDVNQCRNCEGFSPATEFTTIKFKHGFVTMPTEAFNRLPKAKAKRLMKP